MTRSGATLKAKRFTARLQPCSVIRSDDNYECIHSDYVSEYVSDGWVLVASYEYINATVVKKGV